MLPWAEASVSAGDVVCSRGCALHRFAWMGCYSAGEPAHPAIQWLLQVAGAGGVQDLRPCSAEELVLAAVLSLLCSFLLVLVGGEPGALAAQTSL